MKKAIFLMLAVLMALPASGFANILENGEISKKHAHVGSTDWNTGKGRHDAVVRWAASDSYVKKSVGMLGRGISNVGSGWSELIIQPYNWSKNSVVIVGQAQGVVMGATMATLRTLSGALDVATFWVPVWRGIPMGKPALGLNDVHEFEVIEDAEAYDASTKRYFFEEGYDDSMEG